MAHRLASRSQADRLTLAQSNLHAAQEVQPTLGSSAQRIIVLLPLQNHSVVGDCETLIRSDPPHPSSNPAQIREDYSTMCLNASELSSPAQMKEDYYTVPFVRDPPLRSQRNNSTDPSIYSKLLRVETFNRAFVLKTAYDGHMCF
ncbi:hypothetical protein DFH09DRAFT_1094850 [Mycena vulgaris]|nr:hypothetical protein DFH09DRAFT_1094850 [Mycena vulgaris]